MMVRAANSADIPALLSIINPIIRDTTVTFTNVEKSQADIAGMIAPPAAFFVYDTGDTIAGYASYFPFRQGVGYQRTVEYSIVVGPDAKGNGVGRALLNAVSDHVRSAGKTTLVAGICGENADGLAFHDAMAFVRTGLLTGIGHKFGRDLDLVIAQKRL